MHKENNETQLAISKVLTFNLAVYVKAKTSNIVRWMERTLTFNTNFYSELYLYTTCSRDILCVRRRPSRLGRRIETGGAQVALL